MPDEEDSDKKNRKEKRRLQLNDATRKYRERRSLEKKEAKKVAEARRLAQESPEERYDREFKERRRVIQADYESRKKLSKEEQQNKIEEAFVERAAQRADTRAIRDPSWPQMLEIAKELNLDITTPPVDREEARVQSRRRAKVRQSMRYAVKRTARQSEGGSASDQPSLPGPTPSEHQEPHYSNWIHSTSQDDQDLVPYDQSGQNEQGPSNYDPTHLTQQDFDPIELDEQGLAVYRDDEDVDGFIWNLSLHDESQNQDESNPSSWVPSELAPACPYDCTCWRHEDIYN